MLLRDGKVCEACVGKLPWRGVVGKCYRNSAVQSAVSCATVAVHRALGTYRNKVSRYIALTEFARRKFVEGGLPEDKIVVKPNFVDVERPAAVPRVGALYVGRLSNEKGIGVMLDALRMDPTLRLRCVGDGPGRAALAASRQVTLEGFQDAAAVYERMRRAAYLLMPSLWYESFPRVLVEAYACGIPIIAARLGSLAELVKHGHTGLLVEPGSGQALKDAMRWAEDHPEAMAEMGANARSEYERRYTARANYGQLIEIYGGALAATGGQ
jgi:glycosyltransferase involved in cell wall biosynthesis